MKYEKYLSNIDKHELNAMNYCIKTLEDCIRELEIALRSETSKMTVWGLSNAVDILSDRLEKIIKEKRQKFREELDLQRPLMSSSAGWMGELYQF